VGMGIFEKKKRSSSCAIWNTVKVGQNSNCGASHEKEDFDQHPENH